MTFVTSRKLLAVVPLLAVVSALSSTPPSSRSSAGALEQQRREHWRYMWFPDDGMEVAQGSFGWWIMGAAGSGGAARSTFPKLFDDYLELQSLAYPSMTKHSNHSAFGTGQHGSF